MHRYHLIPCLGLPLLLASCADLDPYRREGMWQPTGANLNNMAAMAANPADFLHGRGDDLDDDGAAAAAIAKWRKEGPGGGKKLSSDVLSPSSGGS